MDSCSAWRASAHRGSRERQSRLAPEEASEHGEERSAAEIGGLAFQFLLALANQAVERVGVFHASIVPKRIHHRKSSYD